MRHCQDPNNGTLLEDSELHSEVSDQIDNKIISASPGKWLLPKSQPVVMEAKIYLNDRTYKMFRSSRLAKSDSVLG